MKENFKFFSILIIIIALAISLCLIFSACNSGLNKSDNEQSSTDKVIDGSDNNSSDSNNSSSDNNSNNDSGNSGDNGGNNQEGNVENSNSGSNESTAGTEYTNTESTDTESISTENSEQPSEGILEKPSVKLTIIEGPEYAQDGVICYYRVKAEVTGNPAPRIIFNKDDSNGSWGSNIAQINLTQDEACNLVCDVNNSEGSSSASISLNWVVDDSASKSSETTSEEPNQQETSTDFSNPGNFKIDVNLTTQLVSIYYNDNLLKSLKCSGGTAETPTVTGTFTTTQKIYYAWIPKFNQGAYYWVRFYGSYLFHSVPFDKYGNMIAEEAGKIGIPASHGCVRMALEDAKWFYETLPLGIKVTIHY